MTDTDTVIPRTHNGKPVTDIGYEAFRFCRSLTSAVISDSVTSIGNSAFYYCESLKSVVVGDSVKSIGHWVFDWCGSLA